MPALTDPCATKDCPNQPVEGKRLCWACQMERVRAEGRAHAPPKPTKITRKSVCIKFFLREGDDPERTVEYLSDVMRWRDGFKIEVKEEKL